MCSELLKKEDRTWTTSNIERNYKKQEDLLTEMTWKEIEKRKESPEVSPENKRKLKDLLWKYKRVF